jgi:C1A family cysteine protease
MVAVARKYGWRRGLPDQRDLKFEMPHLAAPLPSKVDLRGGCPEVYDQSELGSCTAQALGGCDHFNLLLKKVHGWSPSRLFIYYNERVLEGTVKEDSGAEIRNGIKAMARWGVCAEACCPYIISKFKNKPAAKCYTQALQNKIVEYRKLDNTQIDALKACLAEGRPFAFGFVVYESFESDEVAQTGKMPIPQPHERPLGGHAVMCVGYDDEMECFIVRNSWGSGWGDKGYFYMPFSIMTSLQMCDDFWVIMR